jgi:hypothetical protein
LPPALVPGQFVPLLYPPPGFLPPIPALAASTVFTPKLLAVPQLVPLWKMKFCSQALQHLVMVRIIIYPSIYFCSTLDRPHWHAKRGLSDWVCPSRM